MIINFLRKNLNFEQSSHKFDLDLLNTHILVSNYENIVIE
jgi:hypothetical protein